MGLVGGLLAAFLFAYTVVRSALEKSAQCSLFGSLVWLKGFIGGVSMLTVPLTGYRNGEIVIFKNNT